MQKKQNTLFIIFLNIKYESNNNIYRQLHRVKKWKIRYFKFIYYFIFENIKFGTLYPHIFPLFEKAVILKVTIVRRLIELFLSDGVVMEYCLNHSPFRLPSGKKKWDISMSEVSPGVRATLCMCVCNLLEINFTEREMIF